ncbi:cellulose binding domain-containing protein [Microbispora sp. ZYX-F-249]|uniref:Cellulose binding domain-containing protein n=1 Tax=Microbispora maris TaxID=3144104 RepID=A0ABV0AH21_9ACTN
MSRKLLWGGLAAVLLAALVVALPAQAAQSLRLRYKTSATGATADQVEPWFDLVNNGTTAVPLNTVKIRYYFRADSPAQQYRFACSWAVISCSTVTGTFQTISPGTATADRYLEVGFTSGSLAAGASTGDLQLRFYRADWQTIRQSDDYSFGPARTTYGDWDKVTVHQGGTLVWGTPPAGVTDPSPSPSPSTSPGGPGGGSGVVFDDFAYASSSDPQITAHNWTVRTNSGGPGVPGASWPASNVSFPVVSGSNKALQLRAATDGTAGGTSQAEFLHQRKFFEGTYAARVKFADAPDSGPDGDNIVETFFTSRLSRTTSTRTTASRTSSTCRTAAGARRARSCTPPPGRPTATSPGSRSTRTPSGRRATPAGTTSCCRSPGARSATSSTARCSPSTAATTTPRRRSR